MKNTKTICCFFLIVTFGCSASREIRHAKRMLTGRWILETVTIEGNNTLLNDSLFYDGANKGFIGSSWIFNSNGSGSYSLLESKDCKSLTRNIHWKLKKEISSANTISIASLNETKLTSADTVTNMLSLTNLTDSSFSLTKLQLHEQPKVEVLYNFVKK